LLIVFKSCAFSSPPASFGAFTIINNFQFVAPSLNYNARHSTSETLLKSIIHVSYDAPSRIVNHINNSNIVAKYNVIKQGFLFKKSINP